MRNIKTLNKIQVDTDPHNDSLMMRESDAKDPQDFIPHSIALRIKTLIPNPSAIDINQIYRSNDYKRSFIQDIQL